jgi:hypothetical protein
LHISIRNRVYKVWFFEIKEEEDKESLQRCLEWFYNQNVNSSSGILLKMAHELGMDRFIEQTLEVLIKESIECPGFEDFASSTLNKVYGKKIIDYGAFLMAMEENRRTTATNTTVDNSPSRDFFKYLFVLECCRQGTFEFICSKTKSY